MVTPRWLDWDLYPESACEHFIYQLQGKGVSSGIWKGIYRGDDLLPDWARKDSISLNDDGSCIVKNLYSWFTDLLDDWAKKFLLIYDECRLHFHIDDGTNEKRIDLSVDVDWQAFCNLWNAGGISFGIGNFDPSPLADEMFGDGHCCLSWDGKKITATLAGKEEGVYTPAEFVRKAVDATANRFRGEFGSWTWLFQRADGWMKAVGWEEFNGLLKKPHAIEYQTDHLQKSYDSSHGDVYQTEIKVAFEDGSALYGATGGVGQNYPFIKEELGFTGDLEDDDCKFALPVPLLACSIWY